MIVSRKPYYKPQEKLAKDDIRLLIDFLEAAKDNHVSESYINPSVTRTRIEMLIGKLKRMEKQ